MNNHFLKLIETKRTIIGFFVLVFCESSYAFSNYLTNSMNPHVLPLSFLDNLVPFVPHTVWIYLSEVLICIAAFYAARDRTNLARYLGSLMVASITAVTFFILFPTIFPRIDYPIPTNMDQMTLGLFNWVRKVDYPTNCLPSLHVCYSFLASFVFLQEQKAKFLFFFIWAILISLSTMTTKQHYFLDVITGFFIAFLSYRLFLYLLPPAKYSSEPQNKPL